MYTAVLLDIDGTLVDSNDAHAHAWVKAFSESGITVEFGKVRRCIGMGADKLMPEVAGLSEDSADGRRIARRRGEIFKSEYLPTLKRFPGADRLVAALQTRGLAVVAASSAKKDELRALLDIAGASSLFGSATSSDDADESKPAPDIVEAALARAFATPKEALMIGDTPYDMEAARRAGVRPIAFRCGGWTDKALKDAFAIYDGPWELLVNLREVFGPEP